MAKSPIARKKASKGATKKVKRKPRKKYTKMRMTVTESSTPTPNVSGDSAQTAGC